MSIEYIYLLYTEGKISSGYAAAVIDGSLHHVAISFRCPKHDLEEVVTAARARYAGATIIETPPLSEEALMDEVLDMMHDPVLRDENASVHDARDALMVFHKARGARVGKMLATGEIEWAS
jgi:hypothetical protein